MFKMNRFYRKCFLAFLMQLLIGASAAAEQQGQVNIELNKLESYKNACRVYLVLKNSSNNAYLDLKLDLVLFDNEGVIARRMALEAAPLVGAKSIVKLFDIDQLSCTNISRILLNDVMACRDNTADTASLSDCLGRITLSSRNNVIFDK